MEGWMAKIYAKIMMDGGWIEKKVGWMDRKNI